MVIVEPCGPSPDGGSPGTCSSGAAKLTAGNRRDPLEVIEDRYGIRSTVLTSQLPVEKWHDAIADPTLSENDLKTKNIIIFN